MSPNIFPFRRYLQPGGEIACRACQQMFPPSANVEIRRVGEQQEAVVRCPYCGHQWVVARA